MRFPFPDIKRELYKEKNDTVTASGLSSGYTVIGVTTIDSTLGWDTVTNSETHSKSDMSTSDEPLTVTQTALEPIVNRPIDEPEVITSIIMSTITHDFMSTVTIDPNSGKDPFSTVQISSPGSPTYIPQPPPTTSTAASPSKSYLSTVELVGIVVGIICLLMIICLPILVIFWRRRRAPPPSDTRNNINITVGSRWSHSDDSRPTPLPVHEPVEDKEVKTEVIKRPIRVVSPPPRYNDYWKGENDEYKLGIRNTGGEPSGSRFAEAHYSDPKGKGKARDDNWI
jgi:hypothetical protein